MAAITYFKVKDGNIRKNAPLDFLEEFSTGSNSIPRTGQQTKHFMRESSARAAQLEHQKLPVYQARLTKII